MLRISCLFGKFNVYGGSLFGYGMDMIFKFEMEYKREAGGSIDPKKTCEVRCGSIDINISFIRCCGMCAGKQ